ncbi:MAG: D-alanyl-D-alanine carboxypeptidase/D-alanyl-D-alanine-endopeptidase [Acidobacteria bacterium]|nr:D-alanyl-D-alanine carboxypeptidase/D-alanyl-D-alanine-endopeptidase [Acidobacteriota bacterium]
MTPRIARAALALLLLSPACAARQQWHGAPAADGRASSVGAISTLAADLDALFDTPPFDTALWSVRIERAGGDVLYEKNPRALAMPASNMKIVTMATAAEALGWDYRFETRLVAEGDVRDGVLHGDLRVIGGGDPSISSVGFGPAPLFGEWARALRAAGITRVTGRLIGDDNAFDDERLGSGWAWDYLAWGYAAPVSALQYGENVAVLRMRAGAREGDPVEVIASPPGHGLRILSTVRTGAPDATANIELERLPGQPTLTVTGVVPAGRPVNIRTASIDNPTQFFVDAFREVLVDSGITVAGPAVDIDETEGYAPSGAPRTIATHQSPPLSELGAHFMKVSQNMYGETFLKAMGRDRAGKILESWGIAPGTYNIADGSGLSRYNLIHASMLTTILRRMYEDDRHRAWFSATLPVAGHDGTLGRRMIGTELQRAVQAKTGTIANARSLSGYLTAPSGERVIFSIMGNNFLRRASEIDAVAEAALTRVLRELASRSPQPPAPASR